MKVETCVLAVLAAVSTAAMAKDLKQDKAPPAAAVKAKVMTDAEMDKVTAGGSLSFGVLNNGLGKNLNSNPNGYFNFGHNEGGFQGNGSNAASTFCCK
jgi:hypothetical protein